MKWIRAFVIGSSFPLFILPLVAYFLGASYLNPETTFRITNAPIGLPVFLGVMNILCLWAKEHMGMIDERVHYFVFGVLYGLLLVSLGFFVYDLPNRYFQTPEHLQYLFFFYAPFIYGVICLYVLRPLNKLFGLHR